MKRILSCAILAWLATIFGGGLFGCKSFTPETSLVFLERGKATGHLVMTGGGSPLSLTAKTVFSAGPENASFSFDGNIDFGDQSTPTPKLATISATTETRTETTTETPAAPVTP